jgi:hypothetical protein
MTSSIDTPAQPSGPSAFDFEMQPYSKSREDVKVGELSSDGHQIPSLSGPENGCDAVNPPDTAVEAKQKWNSPRINMWRVFSAFFSFLIVGMNDGSYGVSVAFWDKLKHI